MFTLYCGSAIDPVRQSVLKSVKSELEDPYTSPQTLVVVPDKLTAFSYCGLVSRGIAGAAVCDQVLDFDTFVDEITGLTAGVSMVSPQIARAIYRDVIESEPQDFETLVGRYSVPRMSQGVLSRIIAGVESLENVVTTEDGEAAESPRRKQLRLLAKRFEQRLQDGGQQQERIARWQAIIDLVPSRWHALYAGVRKVVFLDFAGFSDITYLAMAAVSKQVEALDVLLEFDPNDDAQGGLPLDAAYQRLYDMADLVVSDSAELSPEAGGGSTGEQAVAMPVIVSCESITEEVNAIASLVHTLTSNADEGEIRRLVVAVPNWLTYATPLEKALAEYGVQAQVAAHEPADRGPEFLLLNRLRECASPSMAGASVAALLRSPGFAVLMNGTVSSIDGWDAASRLQNALLLAGEVTGWAALLKAITRVLQGLQDKRRWNHQWTEQEKAHDEALLALLNSTKLAVDKYTGEKHVEDWCSQVSVLLRHFEKAGLVADSGTGDDDQAVWNDPEKSERLLILQALLLQMQGASDAVSAGPVTFGRFLSLFKSAVRGVAIPLDLQKLRAKVIICQPEVAAKLQGSHCLLAGFNDGSFPRFAKPDASFLGYDIQHNQRVMRAREWACLQKLLRNHGHVWLFMPRRQGTEELLPSQFAERLLSADAATMIAADDFLRQNHARRRGFREELEREMADALRGLELTDGEIARFGRRSAGMRNTAHGINVLAGRSRPQLSRYDGILTDPRLKAWIARWVDNHIFSVSQLDGVVGCSFRFFADRILNLDEIDAADDLLPAHVFGSFAHDVLALFYRSWVAAGRSVPKSTEENIAREELVRAYHAAYEDAEDLSDFARDLMNLKLFGELGPEGFSNGEVPLCETSDSGVFGKFLKMEMLRGDSHSMDFLNPSNFEVGFGMPLTDDDDPLSTPECVVMDIGKGHSVRLFGRIDRIDVSPYGVFAVTDYKTGFLPTSTEIAGGFRTQLPVYMLVGQQLLAAQYEQPEPAGGLYYSLKRGKTAKVSAVFVRGVFQQQVGVSGRCMKDEQFLDTLTMVKDRIRHSMNSVRRGYLTTTRHSPKTICNFCSFENLCYRDVERTEAFWNGVDQEDEPADD